MTKPPAPPPITYETDQPVLYEVIDGIAWVTMNRPDFKNAQNGQMTYALDDAFMRAVADDEVGCIVLAGNGKHFSAGHDIGTPGRDLMRQFDNRLMVPPHVNKPAAELLYTREQEQYLGMCRRWRDISKPTIAMVQGACIAGGLMLAWVCDLIVASEDAFFQDPVNRMGIPGVEYFAHAFELPPRVAKEFLLLGERMTAHRAEQFGMVNKVVSRDMLRETVATMAAKLAAQPRLGNWLTKQAINHVEELRGKRTAMDAVFHMHHFAHAQNDLVHGSALGGFSAKAMANTNKRQAEKP
ncbi:enoyl-CoA hydratase [Aquisediminimonas sediminicola]|uniref:enoyl-CoA hydratase n=1 Tax=Alteraquisediminimonas sediminicola TaxID=2676787 RepID=UPI001C8DCFFD|nr:enoyl-CoA hydratase [Aquisediminimonas sediminicola]